MKTIETATTHFTLTDDGIVVGRAINPDTPRTSQNTLEALTELERFIGGKPLPGLWDPRVVDRFPAEAWRTMISRLDRSVVALAILVDDRTAAAVGAFSAAMDSLLLPVKLFTDEGEALRWLGQFIDPK